MSPVLLLYYHLASSGGFSGDETVYLDQDSFDGYSFLNTEVADGYEAEIDQQLIREGSIIYLLCDLNDMVSEFEDSFLSQKTTKRVLHLFNEGWLHAIPETTGLFKLFEADESQFDFDKYNEIMKEIINKYVAGTFNVLANSV